MEKLKINKPKEKLISCACILGVAAAMYFLNITCVFKWLFGIECPGCGITRAYISLLHLDFKQAFAYNHAFWVVPICGVFYLFDSKVFKKKWVNNIVEGSMYVLLILNWIFFKL